MILPRRGNLWVVLGERLQETIPLLLLLLGALQLRDPERL